MTTHTEPTMVERLARVLAIDREDFRDPDTLCAEPDGKMVPYWTYFVGEVRAVLEVLKSDATASRDFVRHIDAILSEGEG